MITSTEGNLTETPDTFWGVDPTRKAANENRAYDKGLEPCTHCGRGVKEGSGFMVVIVNGGEHIAKPGSPEYDNDRDPGYMGAWILGSSCAKGVPAEFRTKWN